MPSTNVSVFSLLRGAATDNTVFRTPASTSYKFEGGTDPQVQSSLLPVVPGKTYTFNCYIKTNLFPNYCYSFAAVYDAGHAFKTNAPGSTWGVSEAGEWQEMTATYTAKPGDAFVRFVVGRSANANPRVTGAMWLTDVTMNDGEVFQKPASLKKAFDGSAVKIDCHGNMQVFKTDHFEPFFPIGIYQVNSKDFSIYANQGFNCVMFNLMGTSLIDKAKQAGMYAFAEIGQYISPLLSSYNDLADFKTRLATLHASSSLSNFLGFYWDNEAYNQYEVPRAVTSYIQSEFRDAGGKRTHPIIMNQGNYGMNRSFEPFVDGLMDYSGDETDDTLREVGARVQYSIIQNVEKQTRPFTIAILSQIASAGKLRSVVYQALIGGAKGIAYYRDGVPTDDPNIGGDFTLRESWIEVPALCAEIKQMMPLIRKPKSTTVTASTASRQVVMGVKELNTDAFITMINGSLNPQEIVVDVTGLSYTSTQIRDYFSGEKVVDVVGGNRFTVTLGAQKSAVYWLARN